MTPTGSPGLWPLVRYFLYLGSLGFGGPVALVGYMQRDLVERRRWFYGGVVQEYRWLTDRQFLDAVAVAMLTPGPVVITVAFIGYLVAGQVGAFLAGLGVFLPVYLFVVIPYPWFDRISGNPQVKAFVDGVTAAAAGAIAGACFVLARRAIVDVPTLLIALLALGVTQRFKISEPYLIAGGAVVGVLASWARA